MLKFAKIKRLQLLFFKVQGGAIQGLCCTAA